MIPFVDLQAQHASLRGELDAAIGRVLDSAQFTLGPEVEAFEQEFAAHCGAAHGIGVNSGSSALHLALLSAGIGPGDEVITVPFTFVATVAAVQCTGARPVLVDVDPVTCTMDPAAVERAITPATKALLPVHLYGHPADMDPLLDIARRHHLTVIEDAAQAHGAHDRGRPVGSLGHMGCFSFYPGKNLGACGEGGMVVTNDPAHARTLRMLRDWGAERKYVHVLKGYNYRLEALQAAVLRVKLRRLEAWTDARRRHAAHYDAALAGSGLGLPVARAGVRHVYHVYAVRTPQRAALQQALLERGVQTGIHYPTPVHLLTAYADLGHRAGDFPVAERLAAQVLSLPMYAELTPAQCDAVCDAVHAALGGPMTAHATAPAPVAPAPAGTPAQVLPL